MVWAAELSASGGETTASNSGGGHSGAESDGSVHLDTALDTIDSKFIDSRHTFAVRAKKRDSPVWRGIRQSIDKYGAKLLGSGFGGSAEARSRGIFLFETV